jgi:hypothetical protein
MSTAVVHYQLPVSVVICAANKGCASDVSAVVFLYIVNDNLHSSSLPTSVRWYMGRTLACIIQLHIKMVLL